jgi:hypothetical protein
MRIFAAAAGCLVLLAIAPSMNVAATTPQSPEMELLKPGATYVSNFPYKDRRAACLLLKYREGTLAFSDCLEGDFPENPWFTT